MEADVARRTFYGHFPNKQALIGGMVVGTLNSLTISWSLDDHYPVFARLEEARLMFDRLICKS